MATGLNIFYAVEELSSPAFRKIAALVSPKRGYPELPDLSDNQRPSYIYRACPKKCIHILRREKICAPRTTTVLRPFIWLTPSF